MAARAAVRTRGSSSCIAPTARREHHTRHERRPTPARQIREPDTLGARTTPSVATIDHTYDDMPALLDNSDSEESNDDSEDEAEKEESNTGWEKKNHWNAAAAGPSAAPAGDAGGHRAPMNGHRSVTCGQAPLDAKKDAPSRSWTLEQLARHQQDEKPDYPVSDRRWDEVTASGRAAGYYPSDRVPLPNVKMESTHTCTRCQSVVEREQETEEMCSSCQAETGSGSTAGIGASASTKPTMVANDGGYQRDGKQLTSPARSASGHYSAHGADGTQRGDERSAPISGGQPARHRAGTIQPHTRPQRPVDGIVADRTTTAEHNREDFQLKLREEAGERALRLVRSIDDSQSRLREQTRHQRRKRKRREARVDQLRGVHRRHTDLVLTQQLWKSQQERQ